ncbi:SIR2 family protein [Halofilum ochraceum]|uniref:SIR2 family protein n=1 Tax=Halofilum ochraceum TaxID=1611323 RepID=UPI000946A281|nr:SIR2 family protein [Halofilum ochraceum]
MSKTFRIVILGAGFSKPAGLPLGDELFAKVREVIKRRYGIDNPIERDLIRYATYIKDCEGISVTIDSVDYEQFMGFLDIEHVLGLKGKDTWSDEGNESQLMIRQGIAEVLNTATPKEVPSLYREFARRLNPDDVIFTFNYDTLLECALEAEEIPYRLFPERFSEIGWASNTIDDSREEVVVIKLHGSIDWFHRAPYERKVEHAQSCPMPYTVKHAVFGERSIVDAVPLTDGPREEGDHLAKIYRVSDVAPLINRGFWECCPLVLTPSHNKIFYSGPLRPFWWGLQRLGGLNRSLSVIGYSLPPYDEYAKQVLYHIFSNFTEVEPDLELAGRKKGPARILDYDPSDKNDAEIRDRYRFVNWDRTEICLDGFSAASMDWILN